MCRSPRVPTGRTWPGRHRSGRCGTPRSPRCWPVTTSPTSRGGDRRSACTGRRRCGRTSTGRASRWPGARWSGVMRANGWRGATRARKVRTTVADPAATRAPDLVNRQFHAAAPGLLHVADFTYVPLAGGGFGYTAFVIDAYAGLIPGWECSTSKHTDFVEAAIRQAVAYRRQQGHPLGQGAIHHSDAGSQPGFKGSSQHRFADVRVGVRSGLRRVSSSRASCGVGC